VTVEFTCPLRKYTAVIRYSDRGALHGAALVVQLPATDSSWWPELSNRYLDLFALRVAVRHQLDRNRRPEALKTEATRRRMAIPSP